MSQQPARIRLTAGRVESFVCPAGKSQAFLWDTDAPALALRATPTGRKTYVFESRLNRETIRIPIGTAADWSLEVARARAHDLKRLIDSGVDPRAQEREQAAAKAAAVDLLAAQNAQQAADRLADSVTVGQAWQRYLQDRRPRWGERNYTDHMKMADPGGRERKRNPGVTTVPGPLAELMGLRLLDLDAKAVEVWATKEAQVRPARVRLALRLLKAFLRWAAAEPDLRTRADATAANAKRAREAAGKPKVKNDYLQREQLKSWFEHVRLIPNPVIGAYLQCLLLTGARREELAALKWDDVNFKWYGIDMKDKIEGRRQVPLTPYVAHLISGLPRRNEWVFSSTRSIDLNDKNAARRARYHQRQGTHAPEGDVAVGSASGRIVEPSIAHRQAIAAAGLQGLTLHGLRRSFASLCEWLDIPGGVSAQIQGHAPQGVREQSYVRRPLDLLRVHHERIEQWILEQAEVKFERAATRETRLAAV